MSVTLAPEARRTVSLFFSGDLGGLEPKFAKKKDDKGATVLNVTDMPIFRSGTFRDSMGFQHTWEDLHMAQMVSNNELLKSRGYFPDPPVRKGHGAFLGDPIDTLIGYIKDLRAQKMTSPADGKEYTYILADYEVIDLDAQIKVENKLWRHRSAEVGFYLNNDDAEFWPVMMGFAFVDIPAVEGLNFSKFPDIGKTCSVMFDKEAPVTTPVDTTQSNGSPGAPAPAAPAQNGTTNHQSATPPAAPPAPPAAAPPAPHSFTVAGKPVSDFAAVQTHINGLEEFQRETMEAGRKSFVSGLAGKNLILASQLEATEKFALGLSDDQYKAWTETFVNAVPNPALGQHGSSAAGNSSGGPQPTPADFALANDKAMYERHKMAGMSQDNIEKTASYKRLKAGNHI